MSDLQFDVVIVGGGIAGIVTATELLNQGRRVAVIDRDKPSRLGGQACEAFGGMWFVDTPLQRAHKIKDSKALALSDWERTAEFGPDDHWQRQWAQSYINEGSEKIYHWLKDLGIDFLPAPGWVERGNYEPGNSVPRYHVMWGTAEKLMRILCARLVRHEHKHNLSLFFYHELTHFTTTDARVTGCVTECQGVDHRFYSDCVVVASGGVTGSENKVRELWPDDWPAAPERILNGSHEYSDGKVHDLAKDELSADVVGLDHFWNYAAGIPHPFSERKDPNHGASLIPARSGLWVNCRGERIGPMPLVSGFDTRDLCLKVCQQERGYTWQVMNWRIAKRELNISGAVFNEGIRNEAKVGFIKDIVTAPDNFLNRIVPLSEDILVADDVPELVAKMNTLTGTQAQDETALSLALQQYDKQLVNPDAYVNDDQVRRVRNLRQWKADKLRICNRQPILDSKAGPLVAIRLHLVTRKSLGGIKTDLSSCVLRKDNSKIDGLYAVGEASGFGGGGINGMRSLEGTFLSLCIFNAMKAANSINKHFKE